MMQYAELGDTVYFPFNVNDATGAAADGTTPVCDVRRAGDSASGAPIHSPTPALLTHANYDPGAYEVAIAATTGNGYTDLATYFVFAGVTVGGVGPRACIGGFSLGKLMTARDSGLNLETTIATLSSQTSFTLTAPASNSNVAYPGLLATIQDADDATKIDIVRISAYVGSTRTVTLVSGTVSFTAAVGDVVRIYGVPHPLDTIHPADIKRVNAITVVGSGTSGDPWRAV